MNDSTEPKPEEAANPPDASPGEGEELVPADDAIVGRAFRGSLMVFAGIAALLALGWLAWWLLRPAPAADEADAGAVAGPRSVAERRAPSPPSPSFREVGAAAGIDFVHVNGAYGERLLPETMGGGVAFFDYDGDGDPDLLFVNSRHWPNHGQPGPPPHLGLYRNDGSGRFEDVTAEAGLDVSLYGMGVAVGDVDGNGLPDVFVTAVGRNRLFRNAGGRFVDITQAAGVAGADDAWSTGAAFFDADGDGDLDLFVANYVRWSRQIDIEIDFRLTGLGRAYGPPTTFEGTYPYFYRNDGHGRFSDVSASSGVQVNNPATGRPMAKALAVVPVDVDDDGDLDLLVANDTVQNFLFRNDGKGRFEEAGAELGVAFDRNGASTGAMGVDAANFRNDRTLAFAVGNFANEMTSLYASQEGMQQFADESIVEGIGGPSRSALTFGLFFFDYDLDGRQDLLQINGHIEDEINRVQPSQHYEQAPQVFWNCGDACDGTFVEVPVAGTGLDTKLVGRGAAYADMDADGDLDVVITQIGRRALLFRNDVDLGHHWLRVRLKGRKPNTQAIGARVELAAGGTTQRRVVMPTRSYLSQVETTLTFGLGEHASVDSLTVTWPDGSTQDVTVDAVDQVLEIDQG